MCPQSHGNSNLSFAILPPFANPLPFNYSISHPGFSRLFVRPTNKTDEDEMLRRTTAKIKNEYHEKGVSNRGKETNDLKRKKGKKEKKTETFMRQGKEVRRREEW